MNEMNDGLLISEQPVGAENTYTVRNESGNWPTPPAEIQYSTNRVTDSMGCVSYSATHCIESQEIALTGSTVGYSERFLAKMSGTTREGNYVQTVFDTIQKYGMVPDSLWPEPANFTWDEYYSAIPQSVIDAGQEFLKKWNVYLRWVAPSEVAQALQEAPIQALIPPPNPNHAVEQINAAEYFDTYQPFVKPLSPVYAHYQIIITPKNPMQFKTQNYKGELRIVLEADSEQTWEALCKVYGIDPKHIDETVA